MQIGLMPGGTHEASGLTSLAAEVEALGFDSLWMGDHVAFPAPILDPLQVLACYAAHTRHLVLGTCVYLLPLRPPGVVAKMVASLDFLCGGRLIFGVGVGGEFPVEFQTCGVPVEERGRRADEAIDVLRQLWAEEPVAYKGRFFDVPAVRLQPLPVQPGGPPIWIGGRSEAALRRAARRGDGYVGYLLTPAGCRRRFERIDALAHAAGRGGTPIARAVMAFAFVDRERGAAVRHAAEVLGAVYGVPMEAAVARYGVLGAPEDCRAAAARYAEAGVEQLILTPLAAGAALRAQISALAEALEIKPRPAAAAPAHGTAASTAVATDTRGRRSRGAR